MKTKLINKVNAEDIKKFMGVATELVTNEVSGTDIGTKEILAIFSARDMAIGERLTKNKHIITGFMLGAVTIILIKKFQDFRKKNKEEVEEDLNEESI